MIDVTRVGWGCTFCATRYALKLSRCPRCHGREFTRGPVIPMPPATVTEDDVDPAAVRAWAASRGIDIAARGRIPALAIEAYRSREG